MELLCIFAGLSNRIEQEEGKNITEAVAQGIQPRDVKMADCTHAALRENVSSSFDMDVKWGNLGSIVYILEKIAKREDIGGVLVAGKSRISAGNTIIRPCRFNMGVSTWALISPVLTISPS